MDFVQVSIILHLLTTSMRHKIFIDARRVAWRLISLKDLRWDIPRGGKSE